ncbi:MAG: hypothetical protein KF787_12145 [Phycisphaeraceae bacterium]|nr:hypothetical protein [Phycisphaerae bacterium]MBX3393387.1 hypothetical protein [Phycisphaeraceae bacterium]
MPLPRLSHVLPNLGDRFDRKALDEHMAQNAHQRLLGDERGCIASALHHEPELNSRV